MGYFDALAASAFKTDEEGRRLFFPWGVLGTGYVIPSHSEYERLRRILVQTLQVVLPAVTLLAVAAPIWVPFLLLIPYGIGHILWVRGATATWEKSGERLSLSQSLSNQARHHSKPMLWFLVIGSSLFTLSGLFILIVRPSEWLVGGGCFVFFGACAAFSFRMLTARRAQTQGSAT